MIRDQRGAAYVEWLIAFPVLWVASLGAYMFSYVCAADMIVERAASAAARAAAVFMADHDSFYSAPSERELYVRAAAQRVTVASPALDPGSVNVAVTGTRGAWSQLTARVQADFDCRPFLVGFLCGPDFHVDLRGEASMPFQGR
jgi:Flp pilus assembly protein TadG